MSSLKRRASGLLVIGILIFIGDRIVAPGLYGWTIFVYAPIVLGAVGAWIVAPATGKASAMAGIAAVGLGSLGFLALGIEGLICTFMSLPLAVPLGAIGGLLVGLVMRMHPEVPRHSGPLAFFLLIPLGTGTLIHDWLAKPSQYEVRTSIEIAAPPQDVWRHVVSFSDLPEPTEWYFRTGLAYPQRARIDGTGVGAIRYCDFSTGSFVEPVEVWDEPRLLQFRVTENPAPMREWGVWGEISPKHLHGYMISKKGQFKLTPLNNGRTLLEGTTWYQHGLWPAQYWRLWSDAIIHRIHLRVLTHIKGLAEEVR